MDKKFCYLKQVELFSELCSLGEATLKTLEETRFENLAQFEKDRERLMNSIIYLDYKIKSSSELLDDQHLYERQKIELSSKISQIDEIIYKKLNQELKNIKQESKDLQKSKESASRFRSLKNLKRGFEVDQKL